MKRLLVATFVTLLLCNTGNAQTKGKGEARLVERWMAAWNSHDVDRVLPLFTNDVLYEDVTFGAVNHGSADLRKFASFFFEAAPDVKFELLDSSVQGRRGFIEWVLSGTDKGIYKTGKAFTVRGVSVINVDHGRINRNLDFYDAASIMRQVGLLPTPDSPKN